MMEERMWSGVCEETAQASNRSRSVPGSKSAVLRAHMVWAAKMIQVPSTNWVTVLGGCCQYLKSAFEEEQMAFAWMIRLPVPSCALSFGVSQVCRVSCCCMRILNAFLLHSRIILYGVNHCIFGVTSHLRFPGISHRTPMLDRCNLRCLCLLSCIAVCRFELLSTWLSLRRANLAL